MPKNFFCVLLSLLMALSSLFFDIRPVFAENNDINLIILHTNDTHAHVQSVQDPKENLIGIGYDRIASYKKELLQENPNVLLLDAGDTLNGQPLAFLSQGESIVELLNRMNPDAMTLGIHDFSYGYPKLKSLEKKMKFPILAANILNTSGEPVFRPYLVKELEDLKIGIFGLASPKSLATLDPETAATLRLTDPVRAAQKAVEALQAQQVHLIIALTHLGNETDGNSENLARLVKGIDVIIDGGSHTALPQGKMVENTLIAGRGAYNRALGIVTVNVYQNIVQSKQARLLLPSEMQKLSADSSITKQIEDTIQIQKAMLNEIVGSSDADLDGAGEIAQIGESGLGTIMTKAMLDMTGADIALINGGSIQTDIRSGNLSRAQLLAAFPSESYIVRKKITGKDLLAALEQGVSRYPEPSSAFPQVAGMSFTLNAGKKVGSRISDLKINDVPVQEEKEYILATNDFVASGQEGYSMIQKSPTLLEHRSCAEILIDYVQKTKTIQGPFAPRIRIVKTTTSVSAPLIPSPGATVQPTPSVTEPKPQQPSISPESLPTPPQPRYYIVQPGEDLSKIARKFNTTWPILAKLNNIKNPDKIYPNQKIILP